MPARKLSRKKPIPNRKGKTTGWRAGTNRVAIGGKSRIACADFVGRDKITKITYGYTAKDVARLIDKVLSFLAGGASFLPDVEHRDVLRAELDGETLTFRAGATLKLGQRRNERAYLLSLTVRREYQIWATKFIPLAAQINVKRAVEAFDMPIVYSEFRVPREGAEPSERIITEPLEDITQALDKHSAFVILGEPGAGKTTTLQKIAFDHARRLLETHEGRVPLFVRLSQQGNRDPFDFLRIEWQRRIGTDFADELAAGRVLLLADGINELPREDRNERLKAWRELVSEYDEANQMVFTSREREYETLLDLPRVRVEPLDDTRIADYLQRNHAEGLAMFLDDPKTRLREMATNPFNLSLLVSAYRDNQRDMSNRGRLFEWFVGELFAREERLAHRGWIDPEIQTRALSQLAFTMQTQGESTTLPIKTARMVMPPTVEFNGEEVSVKPAELFRFGRAATILDPATEPDVRFYHQLLQEYFAALELLRRFEEGEDLSALWRAKRVIEEMPPASVGEWDALPEPPATGWEVTTILACGLAKQPARLMEAIRPLNPVLAGRCLDESGMEKPAAVLQSVREDLMSDLYNPAVHLRARLQAGYTLGRIGDPRFQPQVINGVKVIVPPMVNVPADTYLIGSAGDDPNAAKDEKPPQCVPLAAFQIGRYPVTNAEFGWFIQADGYKDERYWETDLARRWLKGEDVTGGQLEYALQVWRFMQTNADWKAQLERTRLFSPWALEHYESIAGLTEEQLKQALGELAQKSRERPQYWNDNQFNNPSQPVVGITWFEARAYCKWLSEMTGRFYRLPTEAEWEAAARGGDARIYAWGDDWGPSKANTIEGHVLKTSPVGAYAAAVEPSPFGAEDQTGNVWEWTSTLYLPYGEEVGDREDVNSEGGRVVRGGSWLHLQENARCTYRYWYTPDNFYDYVGFRVVSHDSSPSPVKPVVHGHGTRSRMGASAICPRLGR